MDKMPDAAMIATAFHKNADTYDQHIVVQKRIVTQLAAAVALRHDQGLARILDVGTGTGALLEKLHSRYPLARLTGIDVARNMCLLTRQKLASACQVVNGTAECLPFKSGVFDVVVSASVLQWVRDLSAALNEMRRVVRPGGEIRIAFFCDGSLSELQHCFGDVAGNRSIDRGRETSRLHRFWAVEEVALIADSMDFENVVITVETETDWYDDVHSLLRSIKSIGAGTVSGGSGKGLGWRGVLQEVSRHYQERYGKNSMIPATYKVLYLTAHTKLKPVDDTFKLK